MVLNRWKWGEVGKKSESKQRENVRNEQRQEDRRHSWGYFWPHDERPED